MENEDSSEPTSLNLSGTDLSHRELSYAQLLARDYQFGQNFATDSELTAWLDQTCLTPQKHL
jgi:hypothetical protein